MRELGGDGVRPTRRNFLVGAAAGAGALVLPGQEAAAGVAELDPWPYGRNSFATDTVLMFRGNPAHTFYGTGPLPETAPRMLWRHQTPAIPQTLRGKSYVWTGTGWTGTAPKLSDYVYVGSLGGYLYCFEVMTGGLVWSYRAGGLFKSSVCLYDNKVYVGNTDDYLHCVDAATGRRVWALNTGTDLDSSPCVVDGVLYIAGENGHVRALDPQTGGQIWRTYVGGIGPGTEGGSNGSETSPAIADGELYTATFSGDLFSIDIKDGRVRWKARTNDDTDASCVIAGEYVYAASEERDSRLYCFAREDGREVWRYAANRAGYWSTPAYADGRIYIGGDDTNLHCVDARTGQGLWTFKTGGSIWSSPAVVDGKVVFGSRDFHLYCVDAVTGKEVWKVRADGRIISSPCIVGGVIWVGTATGYFYCFGK